MVWACEAERGVTSDEIVESVDVAADGLLGLVPGFKHDAPDEFRLQRLEEALHHAVVVAIPLPDIELSMLCFLSSAW
jgi:hypothetical protein